MSKEPCGDAFCEDCCCRGPAGIGLPPFWAAVDLCCRITLNLSQRRPRDRRNRKAVGRFAPLLTLPHGDVGGLDVPGQAHGIEQRTGLAIECEPQSEFGETGGIAREREG